SVPGACREKTFTTGVTEERRGFPWCPLCNSVTSVVKVLCRGHDKRLRRNLQYRRLMNHPSLREACEVQQRRVDQVGLPSQNQIAQDFPGGGRVHHAVSAEAVGKEEAENFRRLAENWVMIGRH